MSTTLATVPNDEPTAENLPALRERVANVVPMNTATMTSEEFEKIWRVARGLAASGMFKDVSQAEQAFGKMLVGRDLGLSPAQSLQSIYFVEGALQIASVTLASFIRRHEDYDYDVLEHSNEVCSVVFWRTNTERARAALEDWRDTMPRPAPESIVAWLGTSRFTIQDAANAKLVKDHPKSPWRAHPRNMLFARAISNGTKWYAPDLLGGIPVYTEGDALEARPTIVDGGEQAARPAATVQVSVWDQLTARIGAEHAATLREVSERVGETEALAQMRYSGMSDQSLIAEAERLVAARPVAQEPKEPAQPENEPDEAEVVTPVIVPDEQINEEVAPPEREAPLQGEMTPLMSTKLDLEAAIQDASGEERAELERDLAAVETQIAAAEQEGQGRLV